MKRSLQDNLTGNREAGSDAGGAEQTHQTPQGKDAPQEQRAR